MKIIIDRFEGGFAVVELPDGSFCNMPRCLVPDGAGEGAVVDIVYNADDTSATNERIRGKMDKLFGRE